MTGKSATRVAVLASGQGSTFEALVEADRRGEMCAEVVLLIVSRQDALATESARRLGVECMVLDEKLLGSAACDAAMERVLTRRRADLVVLAGYLRKVGPRTLRAFAGRVINTHPAPLPRFGGKGMFGEHVHRAVLQAGVATSAATVHLVDEEYDSGPVIAERPVPVLPGDDVATLRARVQAVERALLVSTISDLADGRVGLLRA
ncbi:MAG: phosphoribosylglycinamide formyltransferase 1 [Thermoleophilaceae bacterium]|jgi:phosphoribosylglycinamide formyltransferase-1|nr:phosphoribosylglycinamide formyltransferase 1 [Thermoleophilaceae bacterium]